MNHKIAAILLTHGFVPFLDAPTGESGWINTSDASITERITYDRPVHAETVWNIPVTVSAWDKTEGPDTAQHTVGFTLGDVIAFLERPNIDRDRALAFLLLELQKDIQAPPKAPAPAHLASNIALDRQILTVRHVAYDPAADLTVALEPMGPMPRCRGIVFGPDPLERGIDHAELLIWRGAPSITPREREYADLTLAALPALLAVLEAALTDGE